MAPPFDDLAFHYHRGGHKWVTDHLKVGKGKNNRKMGTGKIEKERGKIGNRCQMRELFRI
jgi:hypothetical protein